MLTVALPLFRSKLIAWLALESIARQKDIDFDWEIVIFEEDNSGSVGEDEIRTYEQRFKDIGCTKVVYQPLGEWIALGDKWVLMAKASHPLSQAFALVASDNYANPKRLKNTWDAFKNPKINWVQSKRGFWYNIATENSLLYDWDSYKTAISHKCALDMAARTNTVRRFPLGGWSKCVDSWMYRENKRMNDGAVVAWEESDDWKHGLHTDGLNNISNRKTFWNNVRAPFVKTSEDVSSCVPADIWDRLVKSKESIGKHEEIKNENHVDMARGE